MRQGRDPEWLRKSFHLLPPRMPPLISSDPLADPPTSRTDPVVEGSAITLHR